MNKTLTFEKHIDELLMFYVNMQNNYIILGYARKWKTGGRAREQLGESKISLVFYQIKDVLSNPTDTAGG